jgi:hypothetical protein
LESEPLILTDEEIDEYLDVALAEVFTKPGTANVTPADRKKLASLLKHYASKPHPFASCKRDQMRHGLSEEHANRRCAVIKDLIVGNTRWRGGDKKNLSEQELAELRLDADEEFFVWLAETDSGEVLREAEEHDERVGFIQRLSRFLGLSAEEEEPGSVELEARKGDYTPEQWASATILHTGAPDSLDKKDHAIPVRAPDGKPDPELMKAAVRELFNSDAPQPLKRRAARRLMFMYEEIDDNPPDSLKGLAGRFVRELSEESDFPLDTEGDEPVYRLPALELSEAKKVGRKLFKKRLLEVGRNIFHGGKTLDFSRENLAAMVRNFKARAFDQVPLLSEHTDNVFAYLGELVDLDLEGKHLVGTFSVSKKGEELLTDNPRLPTSVGYFEDYVRKADRKKFGPTLQHVATVFKPAKPGLEGWQTVQLGEEAGRVVDLKGAQWSTPETGKENGSVSETTITRGGVSVNEGDRIKWVRNGKELSGGILSLEGEDENATARVELEGGARESVPLSEDTLEVTESAAAYYRRRATELEEQVRTEQSERQRNELSASSAMRMLREQGVERMLEREYLSQGVPPAKVDAARRLLSGEGERDVIELSASGAASVKDDERGKAIKELLEGYKGTVEFGERGTTDLETDEDAARDARITEYAKEHDVSRRQAIRELSERGEVTF